ncbi:MAG: DUF4012 domain-containing protein [Candidatus Daviesbacteria bacterium]|nr:DUF4012 domain-containing protein [Candidatus Daviesbacteria bacterium]
MALVNLTKKLDKMNRSYSMRKQNTHKGLKRLIVILVLLAVSILIPSLFAYMGFKETLVHTRALTKSYENQQFDVMKKEIQETKSSLEKVNIPLNFLFWLRIVPIVGGYYADAKGFINAGVEDLIALEVLFDELESKKDVLGFNGVPKQGPERVSQVILILKESLPFFDKIEANLAKAADSVKDINTNKYPQHFGSFKLRQMMSTAKNFILGASLAVSENRDALSVAPLALGEPTARNYLLLFQNDKEIRPTGGFITAFATLKIDRGQVQTTTSDDIYRLDERLLATCESKICPLTPPDPIVKYLPEVSGVARSAWSMRDSNISPDVPTSAKEFRRMYELLGAGFAFDGIIYIDTQVVEEIIEVTGPIDVFGTKYSAEVDERCNCPNVIYELESYAEIAAKGEQDRKAILGVLMQQILAKVLGADIASLPQFIETVARLANHKHIMFYMHDDTTQKSLSRLNWTGEIKNYDGDYLHINDANFAGGKSNLYVTQEVTQEIKIKDSKVMKKITVEYKNDQPFNTWLNGINRDYVRFYVPKGSKLISSKGSEVSVTTIEDDLEKTVFEAFIQVRPQNSRKLEIEYEVAYNPKDEYKMLVQKQPGAKDFEYKIKINGSQKADFKLDQDKEFKFGI